MRDAVLIVNPFASAVTEARLREVEKVLGRETRLRTVLTERAGHATDLAREACAEADVIFVYAGDGGYNEELRAAAAWIENALEEATR